jgi:two-component system chemotaxis sensor kinase CheA
MEDHRETYRMEAGELLTDMETALLELEKDPTNSDLIARVFRSMHTIKGSGAMFGFEDIAAFTHEAETVLDLVRAGKIPVNKKLINLIFSVGDRVRAMLSADDPKAGLDEGARELVEGFRKFSGAGAEPKPIEKPSPSEPSAAGTIKTFWIRFTPPADLYRTGTNPLRLLDELRGLGTARFLIRAERVPVFDRLDPESCMLGWDAVLETEVDENAVRDVFIFVDGPDAVQVAALPSGPDSTVTDLIKKLKDLRRGNPEADFETLKKLLAPKPVETVPTTPSPAAKDDKNKPKEFGLSNIRVSSDKLDTMVNLVGELVIAQERLNQFASSRSNQEITTIAEELDRLTSELRDATMAMRMLPIGTLFSKFRRLVRDLSAQQGKEIDLVMEGADTELDKTQIEKLEDPMVHLLRNSVDHGIEPSSVRMFSGKPKKGTIRLSAVNSGSDVVIQIQDDGAGIDRNVVRARAVEKGIIAADAIPTDEELLHLIFLPGFSTNQKVTDVSGRGVGMDVVKKNIEALRGVVRVASETGKGSTVTLKLPLTLGIIKGLLVKISEDLFVLPLSEIHECVELSRKEIDRASGNRWISIRGGLVPYIRLRETFSINGKLPQREHVVILSVEGTNVGFAVDEVIGEHQIVIKPLGRMYRNAQCLSGATILGDGTVALILDLNWLAKAA